MIDPKELRLGNLVWEIKNNTPATVLMIIEDHSDWCDPIPITEEWLDKCDKWKKSDWVDKGYGRIGSFGLQHYSKNALWELEIVMDDQCFYGVELKYLHELQNLYYALTKEEVVFNL